VSLLTPENGPSEPAEPSNGADLEIVEVTNEPPAGLILPPRVEAELSDTAGSLGVPGRPFDRRSPFFMGFTGALGVAVAYILVRGIVDIVSVLVIIGISLFVAVGLNPALEWLMQHGFSRGQAVIAVTFAFLCVIAAFAAAAVPPIAHEIHALTVNYPRYKADLVSGKGWAGRLVTDLRLTKYLKGSATLKFPIAGGVLGAGRVVLSLGVATVSVVALTVYFLIALPAVQHLWLSLVPGSRRERVRLLTDEVFDRVGGYMLGNLLTSLVSGVLTFVWLVAFGVPYPLLLGLFVALFDLIPMVGSTIAGIVVSLVALTRGLPVAIGTAAFYVAYRFLEDYLLNPRVMKHTVRVSPGLTILATLIGASLLGLIGALVAIPVAATIYMIVEETVVPRQDAR